MLAACGSGGSGFTLRGFGVEALGVRGLGFGLQGSRRLWKGCFVFLHGALLNSLQGFTRCTGFWEARTSEPY